MVFTRPSALAAAAVVALLAPSVHGVTLGPDRCGQKSSAMVPAMNVTLPYGNATMGTVNVSLAMDKPAVMLESVPSVVGVVCSNSSVAVTFDSAEALSEASAQWMAKAADGGLVLITNHVGNCDAELERGFFQSDKITEQAAALTLTAQTTRTAANATASACEITFAGIPHHPKSASKCAQTKVKRDLSWDPSVTVADSFSIPATVLYAKEPYVSIDLDEATVSASATLSGKVAFDFWTFALTELYVDITSTLSAGVGLTVTADAPYATDVAYTAPALEYDFVNVPGILELGPALLFDIGIDFDVDAAVNVSANVGAAIDAGFVHIDFRDQSKSSASGWTPTYTAAVDISEKASVRADPYVDLTVELECKVLGGLLDLSVGLEAEPRFYNTFSLSAGQDISAADGVQAGDVSAASCPQGVAVDSVFDFTLNAKVTQFWSGTIYNVSVPIADECYTFEY